MLAITAGLNDIARASIIGSVTGNILMILGLALFLGGWKNGIQKFNARLAATNSSMLVLAVIGMGIPTLFHSVEPTAHDAELLSVWTGVVLVVIYLAYVYFAFTTPGLRYIVAGHESTWSRRESVIALALAAVATGVVSEVLVKSIEPVVHDWGLPRAFIGFVLVPFVGNVRRALLGGAPGLPRQRRFRDGHLVRLGDPGGAVRLVGGRVRVAHRGPPPDARVPAARAGRARGGGHRARRWSRAAARPTGWKASS